MGDYILLDGDTVEWIAAFGAAVVDVQEGQMKASGPATLSGKKLCVDGDEKNVEVQNCQYFSSSFPIPGKGTLKITQLGSDQVAQKTQTGGKKVLLKGTMFTAEFDVTQQAKQTLPNGSQMPDPMPKYTGNGSFTTNNSKFTGT